MNQFQEFIIQELQNFVNIKLLLDTTKKFKEYKYYKFNKIYSLKYLIDIEFYNHINTLLTPNKQLSLSIELDDINNPSVFFEFTKIVRPVGEIQLKNIENCHTIKLRNCKNILLLATNQ